jgi:hypothetical protein
MNDPSETIDHPPHYNVGPIEVIDAIEAWELGFHRAQPVARIRKSHGFCEISGKTVHFQAGSKSAASRTSSQFYVFISCAEIAGCENPASYTEIPHESRSK